MVHSNKLVVALKVGGKFLRDTKDLDNNNEVFIPFGSEYSIFIKNLHSERALVDIDVDGESAITGLVVDAKNDTRYTLNWVELERFHKGNNLNGHRFKFIEKTQEISEHRGDGPEDGLIVVRYRFEKPRPVFPTYRSRITRKTFIPENDNWTADSWSGDDHYDNGSQGMSFGGTLCSASPAPVPQASAMFNQEVSDAGITVEGSHSNQSFHTTTFGETETTLHSIVLKLRGMVEEQKVVKSVTTRSRVTCKTCGKKCETSWKMCSQCGTSVRASATV